MIPLRDSIPSRTVPLVTWTLIAVNFGVFLYEFALGPRTLEAFVYVFGLVPARYSNPEWARAAGLATGDYWPFVTSMFVHGGWLHVIGNMWMLWIFGDNVEDCMGHARFLLFYVLTGLVAAAIHCLTNLGSTVPMVGASGAIAGVLGAYFILFPRSRIVTLIPVFFWPFFFELPAVIVLLFWFVTQLISGTLVGLGPHNLGGVAFWAHVGGFTAGVLLHRLFLLPPRRPPDRWQRDEHGIERAWLP